MPYGDPRAMRRQFAMELYNGLQVVWPILSALLVLIVGLSIVIGLIEGWSISESVYFAFVTGMTVGYGDFVPKHFLTRMLAIGIAICGILLTGLVAAIAVKALNFDLKKNDE